VKKTTLLLVVAALVVVALIAARFYVTDADFRLTNPSWNGLSSMGRDVQPLYDISSLADAGNGDTLMIIGPATNYTPDESSRVARFLYGGGRVVVMDDFGKADSLLTGIGSPITIDPVPMCQYENYYINQSFPAITDIASSPFTMNVSRLVLNHPAVLKVRGNADIIASTSSDAWLDHNDNARLDADERTGTYPVVARYTMGKGELIVVSDADLFINGMLDKGDNGVFLKGLSRGTVLVDVSHGSPVSPMGVVFYSLKYDIVAQLAVILLIMAACIAYMGRDMLVPLMARLGRSIKNLILMKFTVKGKDIKESDKKL